MNQELANVIRLYSTGSHEDLSSYLIGKSKDTLIGILAGYKHKEGKIGYNGFKQDTVVSGKTIKCEAKPKNVDTNSIPLRKLNGN